MALDVLSALELDKELLNGKFILIKETSGIEAQFVNSCLISKQIKDKGALVLLTLHHSSTHYHNVGLKIGYNLNNLIQSKTVAVIDCLDFIRKDLNESDKTSIDLLSTDKCLDGLYDLVETTVNELSKSHDSVCLLIDDLTALLDLDFTINEINLFVQQCRSCIFSNESNSFVTNVHVISDLDSSYVISGLISHMADVICEVSALKTGRSRDVSGVLSISRPSVDSMMAYTQNNLMRLNNYHYKLFDRGVKVFAPGTK